MGDDPGSLGRRSRGKEVPPSHGVGVLQPKLGKTGWVASRGHSAASVRKRAKGAFCLDQRKAKAD